MQQEAHSNNPYTLGAPAAPIGRVRPFPASMLANLVKTLLSKAAGNLTVLVAVGSTVQAPLVNALEGLNQYNLSSRGDGAYLLQSSGLASSRQVIIVDGFDHSLFAAAASRATPADTETVIVTLGHLPPMTALGRLEVQRQAIRYQLEEIAA